MSFSIVGGNLAVASRVWQSHYTETILPWLPRVFLPYENPIGFGLQDAVELVLALLFAVCAWARPFRKLRRQSYEDFATLAVIVITAHLLLAYATSRISQPASRISQPASRVPPVNSTAPAPPPQGKKQVSPFEEVK